MYLYHILTFAMTTVQSNPAPATVPTTEVKEIKKRKRKLQDPPAVTPTQSATPQQEPAKKKKAKGEYEKIKNKRGKLVSKARYEAALKRPLPEAFLQNARRAAKAKKKAV